MFSSLLILIRMEHDMDTLHPSGLVREQSTPPADIMGVEISGSNLIKSWHIDYLTITVWGKYLSSAFNTFFADRGIFRPLWSLEHGGRFYQDTYTTDLSIIVRERPVEELTDRCTIEIPGKACQLLGYKELSNFMEFLRINYEKVRCNRIDTAFDNVGFKVQDVIDCLKSDDLRSYFKRETIRTYDNPYELKENDEIGTSGVSIGGRSSTRYLRCYDKHGYTRLEIEYKAEKAEQVASDILDCNDEQEALIAAMGHVCDYVEFFTDWWKYFMENYQRLYAKLPTDVKEMTLDRIKTWFESQIAAAYYVLSDLGDEHYLDYLKWVGKCKYEKSKYRGLINMCKKSEVVAL